MNEEVLAGGDVNVVVRVEDTVRRPTGRWSPAVHALLRHFESVGFDGAPRFLGIDDRGREILGYVEGVAALPPVPADDEAVVELAPRPADARRPGGLRSPGSVVHTG
jgi:hypothetical protein